MRRHTTTLAIFGFLFGAICLAPSAMACMDHEEWDYMEESVEPMVEPMLECERDMDCPSGMLCEPVACCTAEDCVCPAGYCESPSTGAQGRDCVADADCGAGFDCVAGAFARCDEASGGAPQACHEASMGWCEAQPEPMPMGEGDDIIHGLVGCQGGTDHSLPMSLAVFLLAGALLRRRQLA